MAPADKPSLGDSKAARGRADVGHQGGAGCGVPLHPGGKRQRGKSLPGRGCIGARGGVGYGEGGRAWLGGAVSDCRTGLPACRGGNMDGHSTARFPGESAAYRAARDELLAAERDLRRHVEQVAELRRKLPLGGEVPEDYVFDDGAGLVKLPDLFREGVDTLALYSFMFSPEMKQACPMCTSFLDSLDGAAPHAGQRLNLAVVAKSPIGRIREFAYGRGWRNLRLLSSAGNTYNRDYHGENAAGGQMPVFNLFVRRDGT